MATTERPKWCRKALQNIPGAIIGITGTLVVQLVLHHIWAPQLRWTMSAPQDCAIYGRAPSGSSNNPLIASTTITLRNSGKTPSHNVVVQVILPAGNSAVCLDGFPEFEHRLASGEFSKIGEGRLFFAKEPYVVTCRLSQLAPSVKVPLTLMYLRPPGAPLISPDVLVHDDHGIAAGANVAPPPPRATRRDLPVLSPPDASSEPYLALHCEYTIDREWGTYRENLFQPTDKYLVTQLGLRVVNRGYDMSRDIHIQVGLPVGCFGTRLSGFPELEYRLPSGDYRRLGSGHIQLADRPKWVNLRLSKLAPNITFEVALLFCREKGTLLGEPNVLVFDETGPSEAVEIGTDKKPVDSN